MTNRIIDTSASRRSIIKGLAGGTVLALAPGLALADAKRPLIGMIPENTPAIPISRPSGKVPRLPARNAASTCCSTVRPTRTSRRRPTSSTA